MATLSDVQIDRIGQHTVLRHNFLIYLNMEAEIIEQLNRIEKNSLLAAKNVLTLEDVSIITKMRKSYLYKLTHKHEIPFYRPNGKMIYFDKKEVEDWMKQNRVESISNIENKANEYIRQKYSRQQSSCHK